jgi:hypothetical protein
MDADNRVKPTALALGGTSHLVPLGRVQRAAALGAKRKGKFRSGASGFAPERTATVGPNTDGMTCKAGGRMDRLITVTLF